MRVGTFGNRLLGRNGFSAFEGQRVPVRGIFAARIFCSSPSLVKVHRKEYLLEFDELGPLFELSNVDKNLLCLLFQSLQCIVFSELLLPS